MFNKNCRATSNSLSSQPRRVVPNCQLTEDNLKTGHPQALKSYHDNSVKSTRYTMLNFLPISFFIQFRKVINCFYLVNMIL